VQASAPDEDEKPLGSFAIVPKHAPVPAPMWWIVARAEIQQSAPDSAEEVVVPHTPRAHDPPILRTTHPRAPPA
jgi:hypothetical protein